MLVLLTFSLPVTSGDKCFTYTSTVKTYKCLEPTGNCVWWAAYKRPDIGVAVKGSGAAKNWYKRASEAGFNVGSTPEVDAIAVFSSPSHVAYVESKNDDGSFNVSEMDATDKMGRGKLTATYHPCLDGKYARNNECPGNWTLTGFIYSLGEVQNQQQEIQTKCLGNVCWYPADTSCEQANEWYQFKNEPIVPNVISVGSYACLSTKQKIDAITQNIDHRAEVPEEKSWQSWWRYFLSFVGPDASAAKVTDTIYNTYVYRTININTQNLVSGNGSSISHGTGTGYFTPATDPVVNGLPDFITRKTWLVNESGAESYQYTPNQTISMKAQFANIGPIACTGKKKIKVHFYLSNGYKEDDHSQWQLVGTDEIKCTNLEPKDTQTETEGLKISSYNLAPGSIHNIVACVDHPKTDHNNGGDFAEEHESNNCSTEAVFEVATESTTPPDPVTPPYVDFTTNSFGFLQTPYYAGDQARLGGNIYTDGTMTSPSGIRSSYSVECPGTGRVLLTDDGTDGKDLIPGSNNWEETIAAVTMPNASGSCTAYFCADYQGAVSESDENNNCSSFSFELQPRPKPNLTITKFEDQKGCCTTNTGEYVYPDIWISNSGLAAPESNVRVLYKIKSSDNAEWSTIGYGTIEPRELPPGSTDEDYMDTSEQRWQIPKGDAWEKQWHTIMACVNIQGGEPTCGSSDSVSTYTRYSKK